MSQFPTRLQTEIFQKKPYLKNYFPQEFSSLYSRSENEFLDPADMRHNYDYVSLNQSPYSLKPGPKKYLQLHLEEKPLSSSYDPYKQCLRILESPAYTNRDIIIVMGMGNPYIFPILHKNTIPNQVILVIDIAEELVPILWEEYLEEFLTVPGRHVFSGESFIPLLWNYMDGLNIERMSGIRFYKNPDSIRLAPEFYNELEESLANIFSAKMSDLLTKFEFENLWLGNILKNTVQFSTYNATNIISLENILTGIPVVLVSAGPSLRSMVPVLHKIRDKVFIMSCDTSLKVLLSSGIVPDAVYTLDAQLNSIFHFLGEDLGYIPCFADMVSSPYLLDNLSSPGIVFSMTSKFIHKVDGGMQREVTAGGEFAEMYLGDIGDIQSGGSVATTAFDALRFMGAKDFFFIGQDLAYTGREIHSTGTHHNEKWLTQIHRKKSLEWINEAVVRKRDTRLVASVNGKKVLSDYVLDLYKSWFEDSVATLQAQDENFSFFNISNAGAYINGMEQGGMNELLEKFNYFGDHSYPWRKTFPWNPENAVKNNIKKTHTPDELKKILKKSVESLFENLTKWKGSETWEEESKLWFESYPYFQKILRKTEVYINRHRDVLDKSRKKDLFLDALSKEFKRLKRRLYPILGLEFLGGDNNLES